MNLLSFFIKPIIMTFFFDHAPQLSMIGGICRILMTRGQRMRILESKSKLLHMCFERFLLAFESRDLSQADNRITRVSSFPSFNFWMINYNYTQKSYLALWQNCFGQFITQKLSSLKSKQFSQFLLVRGKSERVDKIQFLESSGLRPERQKNNSYYSSLSLGKKTRF